jgi:hypothetical protein
MMGGVVGAFGDAGGAGGLAVAAAADKTGICIKRVHLGQRAFLPWLSSGTWDTVWQFEHLMRRLTMTPSRWKP